MANIPGQYNKIAKILNKIIEKGWRTATHQWPVDMVILPTSVCNLNCVHCIFRNRNKKRSIPWSKLDPFIRTCAAHGVEAIEYSGGEPTLYPQISQCIRLVHELGMKQGLITNGLALTTTLSEEEQGFCAWIRVSLDALTYGIPIPHPNIPETTRLTTSYIWSSASTESILAEVAQWSGIQGTPCRVVPDAFLPLGSELREACKKACKAIGYPLVLINRDENRKVPDYCLMANWKPALAWDSFLYACCYSAVREWGMDLCPEFRTAPMEQIEPYYETTPIHDLGHRCSSCLGWMENNILGAARSPIEDPSFL